MKIAIFGDSFAVNEIENGRVTDKKRVKNGFSYTNELSKKYDVVNFAESGTGLFWSYEKYLEHAQDFDKVIFVASSNDRVLLQHDSKKYLPLNWSYTNIPTNKADRQRIRDGWKHIYNRSTVPYSWDEARKHVQWYYRYIFNERQSNLMSKLMIQELEEDPNTLVIPAFQTSYKVGTDVFIKNYNCSTCLFEILQELEHPYYKHNFSDGSDTKFCHFSDENNKILFEKIQKWIETKEFTLHVDDFVIPSDNAKKYLPS